MISVLPIGLSVFSQSRSQRLIKRQAVSLLTEIPPAKANRWPHCVENDAVSEIIEETIGRPALTKAKYPCQNYPLSKLASRSSKASQIQSGWSSRASQAINTEQHHGNFQCWPFTDIALNTRRTYNNTCGSCPAMSSSLKTHLTKTVTFWPDVCAAYFEATCSYVRLTTMPSLGLFQLLNNVRPALYKPTRFLQYHTITIPSQPCI